MKQIILYLIKMYQKLISPLVGSSCRFYPSCSHYARQAIEEYGVVKGGWLSLKRVGKCHPYHQGPFDDPVKPAGKSER